ncbi:uncharacterized protein LOC114366758 [Ostrinia furnacalis]|uniref:uncharacterized protein LOC114366758 n=1 Tax=Ostrinia furnacalis TaxID=93504 RepID=UPI00103B7539|nr:uncharacterized protein LOC114366758 [Ostrinia furnacalis]
MTSIVKEDVMQPKTLQEAINIIKFLQTTHKEEVSKLKESYTKQAAIIKKLEANRKKELEFLSNELQNYEISLALRTDTVKKQLAEKDEIIQKQLEEIEELNKKLKERQCIIPEIVVESNSDSGVAMENDDSGSKVGEIQKTEIKATRKCSRKFSDHISFLRRVDFSPIKYKPSNRDAAKKKDEKKNTLEVPVTMKRILTRQFSNDRPMSDDDRVMEEATFSDSNLEPIIVRPKKLNGSMNNHFSDDGSDDTSEEIFDRVMTRSSIRRSVKANPKYKKINRSKSKLLDQVKVNIVN